jgi:hypothetical protein
LVFIAGGLQSLNFMQTRLIPLSQVGQYVV